ncbi:MAG: S-layer homology domain-containing protein [Planctomycetota bacterium]
MRRGQSRVVWCVAGVFLIAAAASAGEAPQTMVQWAAAQSSGVPAAPGVVPDWGISTTLVKTIHAMGFVPLDSGVTVAFSFPQSGYQRYGVAGLATVDASLDLPSGAHLVGIELDGCDSSATGEVQLAVFESPKLYSGTFSSPAFLLTGTAATPGCGSFYAAAASQITVDNANSSYGVEVWTSSGSSATSFKAVRVFYGLQVSPAPASATFLDVPVAHPLFQYVEALAASGISVGCGGGNFCPDAGVTRGQIAVFLSKALGLHFAP